MTTEIEASPCENCVWSEYATLTIARHEADIERLTSENEALRSALGKVRNAVEAYQRVHGVLTDRDRALMGICIGQIDAALSKKGEGE